ncbi:MAG TPA: hypothetical protein QGF05_02190 [Dehalococcoidia bacterium]|nr:hypothetical protein [Dehalococcoidia bacterium]
MKEPRSDQLVAREWAVLRALAHGARSLSALATASKFPRSQVGVTAKRLLDLDYVGRQREAGANAGRRLYALSPRGALARRRAAQA